MRFKSIDVPQADTLPLVVRLLACLWPSGKGTRREIASELGVDSRQVAYYKQAARILDLIRISGNSVQFTNRGKALMEETRPATRATMLKEAVRANAIMRELLRDRRPEEVSQSLAERVLRTHTNLTGTTVPRRAHTLLCWLHSVEDFDPLDLQAVARKAAEGAQSQFDRYRSHEEGPIHRGIKEAIASDPERYLGENLRLVMMEFPFPTNDRADVLFVDRNERFVVVEVEVDVGPGELPGLLQAVKYKHMLAVLTGRSSDDVRGLLAARSIASAMKGRASFYKIECKEVKDVA
jgi:hypothetical protein